jgi:hypothetical protein
MSTRQLTVALLTIATTGLAACADVTSPTRSAPLSPSTRASLDLTDHVCKTGTWSSSTGRCE